MTSLTKKEFLTDIDPIDGEIWVPIFRKYAVSNMGRVKSTCWGYDLLMRPYKNNRNYDCVDFRVMGKKYKSTVHRLVALLFVNNINPNRITVNNKNGKDDNRSSSLEWMTHSENSRHGADNDLLQRGSRHYATTLDDIQVKTIKSINGALSRASIARYFNVNPRVVSDIIRGKSWKHIKL